MNDKPDPMDPTALWAQIKLLQAALVVALRELKQVRAERDEALAALDRLEDTTDIDAAWDPELRETKTVLN